MEMGGAAKFGLGKRKKKMAKAKSRLLFTSAATPKLTKSTAAGIFFAAAVLFFPVGLNVEIEGELVRVGAQANRVYVGAFEFDVFGD